jgi:hypothetical protein
MVLENPEPIQNRRPRGGTPPSDVEPPRPPVSVRDLERAIVVATLAGRHGTADLLADRLRERLALDRGNVVRLEPRGRDRER